MKILKSYTFTWWQMGIFKLALLTIGIIIGSYWCTLFDNYLTVLFVVAVATSAYFIYTALQQVGE